MNLTIEQLESHLERKLTESSVFQEYIREHYHPLVQLFSNDKAKPRKKKRNASADSWSPDSGEIHISFQRIEPPASKATEASQERVQESLPHVEALAPIPTPGIDLVRALNRAESRPGFGFVSLKWFRDLFLPAEGFDWAQSNESRDKHLREAISQGWIVTSKKPNPKAPQFPVTAICLNQRHAEVARILGTRAPAPSLAERDFAPIEIRGESLSQTVLRERR
jgi:hypothetical protein